MYNACDILNIVHVMSLIPNVVVIKCGYDVLNSAFNGIHMPSVMPYAVGVMSFTESV